MKTKIMKKETIIWDTSDLDPTTLPANDCRRFNGGYICPETPPKTPKSRRVQKGVPPIIVIDRLRP